MNNYILKDGRLVQVDDTTEWIRWFENIENRILARANIGRHQVSTVFLGINHGDVDGAPVLWETMIFWDTPGYDDYQERYTSEADALAGHDRAIAVAKAQRGRGQ